MLALQGELASLVYETCVEEALGYLPLAEPLGCPVTLMTCGFIGRKCCMCTEIIF